MKPCTDVEYEVTQSKEVIDPSYISGLTGCPFGQPFANLLFRRKIEIENVSLCQTCIHIFRCLHSRKNTLST